MLKFNLKKLILLFLGFNAIAIFAVVIFVIWVFVGRFYLHKEFLNFDFNSKMGKYLFLQHDKQSILGFDFNYNRDKIVYFVGKPSYSPSEWIHTVDIYYWDRQNGSSKIGSIMLTPAFYSYGIDSDSNDIFYVYGFKKVLLIHNGKVVEEIGSKSISDFTNGNAIANEDEKNQMQSYCQKIKNEASSIKNIGILNYGEENKFYGYYLVRFKDDSSVAASSEICNRSLVLNPSIQNETNILRNTNLVIQDKNDKGAYHRAFRMSDYSNNLSFETYLLNPGCSDECKWFYNVTFYDKKFKTYSDDVYIPKSQYLTNSDGNLIWLQDGKLYRINPN